MKVKLTNVHTRPVMGPVRYIQPGECVTVELNQSALTPYEDSAFFEVKRIQNRKKRGVSKTESTGDN